MKTKAEEIAAKLAETIKLTPEQEIDQFAQDWYWKQENKGRLNRLENSAKKYRERFSKSDATATFELKGNEHKIVLGPKENQRTVNVATAIKLWTQKKLKDIFSITITALEATVGKDEAAKAITSDQTGSRDITVVPLVKEPAK